MQDTDDVRNPALSTTDLPWENKDFKTLLSGISNSSHVATRNLEPNLDFVDPDIPQSLMPWDDEAFKTLLSQTSHLGISTKNDKLGGQAPLITSSMCISCQVE